MKPNMNHIAIAARRKSKFTKEKINISRRRHPIRNISRLFDHFAAVQRSYGETQFASARLKIICPIRLCSDIDLSRSFIESGWGFAAEQEDAWLVELITCSRLEWHKFIYQRRNQTLASYKTAIRIASNQIKAIIWADSSNWCWVVRVSVPQNAPSTIRFQIS